MCCVVMSLKSLDYSQRLSGSSRGVSVGHFPLSGLCNFAEFYMHEKLYHALKEGEENPQQHVLLKESKALQLQTA